MGEISPLRNLTLLLMMLVAQMAMANGKIVDQDINSNAAIEESKLAALSPSMACETDASGFITTDSSTTATELGYVHGVTSAIQTQLNGKANTALSNLASVAVNTSLLPGTTDSINLGSESYQWLDGFISMLEDNGGKKSVDVQDHQLYDANNNLILDFSDLAGNFYEPIGLNGSGSNGITFNPPASGIAYGVTFPSAQCTSGQAWAFGSSGAMSCASYQGTSLASADIWVGNSGGTAAAVAMSGGATINDSGVVTLGNSAVTGQALTGFSSTTGTVTSSDSILTAIEKLVGNAASYITSIVAGTGINVAGNTVSIATTAVSPGSYTCSNITVNQQGQITSASNGTCTGSSGGGGGTGGNGITTQEVPSGAVNGSNTSFTVTYPLTSSSTMSFFIDGLLQQQGVDYTISGSGITTSAAPLTGDSLEAVYTRVDPGGISNQEVPSGAVNGSNTSYTLSWTPITNNSVAFFIDGLIQTQGTDYTISGTSIVAAVAPLTGDNILALYTRSGGLGGVTNQETPSGSVNGSNTSFTISASPSSNSALEFFINGLLQNQGTDYTITGTSITTAVAPLSGDILAALYATVANVAQDTPTGSINGSNTTFAMSGTPVSNVSYRLFLNGLFQRQGTDYTIAGTTITMAVAPLTGDVLTEIFEY